MRVSALLCLLLGGPARRSGGATRVNAAHRVTRVREGKRTVAAMTGEFNVCATRRHSPPARRVRQSRSCSRKCTEHGADRQATPAPAVTNEYRYPAFSLGVQHDQLEIRNVASHLAIAVCSLRAGSVIQDDTAPGRRRG